MAEIAVGLVVDKLISLLSEEANLLRGVHKEVDGINRELRSIQAFLKDADKRAEAERDGGSCSGVILWVSELREVAEKIEDSIDEYIQDIAERRENQQEKNSLRHRFVCFLRKVSCFIVKLKPRHEIAIKIQELKQEVLSINRRGNDYKFVSFHQGSSSTTNHPNGSWFDLPYNVKSCFLYLGIFPEDYSINSHRLVRQWIAEGFVKPRKGKTVEVVAEEYLTELINRSMVQVSETDRKGGVRSCRVHDIVREFILTHLEDLNICKVVSKSDSYDFQRLTARRVSFVPGSHGDSNSGDIPKTSRIRSVFSFDEDENLNPLVCTIVSNLKLVKVLDFEDCKGLDLLPDDIGNLFHLRYLSVRGTRVKILPKSIGKLENLETLDLKMSLVYELPVEMNKLLKLRHLLAYHKSDPIYNPISSRRGVKIQKGFGNIKVLQKLYMVEANVEGVNVVEEVSKLKELRKLGMSKLRGEDGKMLCECIQGLKLLESLEVFSVSEDEVLDCESISSPPQSLRYLALHGRLRKFPEWITKLGNLVKLAVRWSKLKEDPLTSLRHLPNLLYVSITNDGFYGEKLQFEKGTFPKLKQLNLYGLSRLSSLVIEEGALPNLETLRIGSCPQLKEVPLHHLSLKEFNGMPIWLHHLSLLEFDGMRSETSIGGAW